MRRILRRSLVFVLAAGACLAQSLAEFEKRVSEFTLENGMHFIVLKRDPAPVVSFFAYVDAGAVNDPRGKTGLAHMFEHMVGKGTTRVGTTDYAQEKQVLEEIERIYDEIDNERRKGSRADRARLDELEGRLRAAIEKANQFVKPNEFVRLFEANGAVGFNAGTGSDYTVYFCSMPANRLELWFLLMSEWLRQPVYREFYKERDVVREERRMRVESSPQGKLQEVLMATAFLAHPYRILVGWASDIDNLRARDAAEFHRTYYVPSNITIAIAGDVEANEIRLLAERYFGRIPPGPEPPRVITEEPPQEGERRVTVETPAQPILLVAYKRPDQRHADDPVFDVLASLLASGRTGLLYRELVRDKRIALAAGAVPAVPAAKFPSLFLIYSVPNAGHTIEENEKAVYEILERLQREPVEEAALARVKTKIRADLIRQLASNAGLARQLAFYHVNYGNWRTLFTGIEEIEKVTAGDVQRVARQYLRPSKRTVAYHVRPEANPEEERR